MSYVNFGRSKTKAQALASNNADKIFFPTDDTSIILGGKEFGKAPVVQATNVTLVPSTDNLSFDIPGTKQELINLYNKHKSNLVICVTYQGNDTCLQIVNTEVYDNEIAGFYCNGLIASNTYAIIGWNDTKWTGMIAKSQLSYNDLSNTPTIPTKISDLTNDKACYITATNVVVSGDNMTFEVRKTKQEFLDLYSRFKGSLCIVVPHSSYEYLFELNMGIDLGSNVWAFTGGNRQSMTDFTMSYSDEDGFWVGEAVVNRLSASDVGLGNVGNYKAVSVNYNQGLTDNEKKNARDNIGAVSKEEVKDITALEAEYLGIVTSYTIDQRQNTDSSWKLPEDMIIQDIAAKDDNVQVYIGNELVYRNVIRRIRQKSKLVAGKWENNKLTCFECDPTDSTKKKSDGSTIDYATNGLDCYMKLPQFWWKVTELDTDVYKVSFCMDANYVDNTWNEWEGNTFIGVHEAYSNGTTIFSQPGVTPTVDISWNDLKSLCYAKASNTDYTFITYEAHCIMALLGYGYLGTTDAQSVCGYGTSSYPKTTTAVNLETDTNSTDGNTKSINFWGLENWWGDLYEWISNFMTAGSYNVNILEKDLSTVKRLVTTNLSGNDGEIKKMVLGANGDLIPKQIVSNDNYNRGYADYSYVDSDAGYVAQRSFNGAGASGGLGCLATYFDPSDAFSDIGSRLLYNGTYKIN